MTWEGIGTGRAAELRRAFDGSFAEPPSRMTDASEDILSVRVGPAGYALRVGDISAVFADVKITPVPTNVPDLLGIAAFRGSILPVYDLRALLGYVVETRPRWLAVVAATPLGLAFDQLEGQRRLSRDAVVSHCGRGSAQRHVAGIAELDGVPRPIVSVDSVLEEVRIRLRTSTSDKE